MDAHTALCAAAGRRRPPHYHQRPSGATSGACSRRVCGLGRQLRYRPPPGAALFRDIAIKGAWPFPGGRSALVALPFADRWPTLRLVPAGWSDPPGGLLST